MTRLRFLCPIGVMVLGGIPGRPVVWLHEPLHIAWAAAFPRPRAGETPCECTHDVDAHPRGRLCQVKGCPCLFFRAVRVVA